jgi:hypothetical protein
VPTLRQRPWARGPNLRRRRARDAEGGGGGGAPGGGGGGPLTIPTPDYLWQLDESSGTRVAALGGRDLSEIGSVGSTTGKLSDAARFTGTGTDRLQNTPFSGDIIRTIGCWWRPQGTVSSDGVIAGQVISTPVPNVRFNLREKLNRTQVQAAIFVFTCTVTLNQVVDEWHYLLAILSGSSFEPRLSVDGGAFAASDFGGPGSGLEALQHLHVGDSNDGGLPLNGDVDQLALWKAELTEANAQALYNGGAGRLLP